MKPSRRQFLRLAAGAAALPALPRIARAQAYPTRPITLIVPFAAGGPTDTIARIVTEGMRASLGQPIIIENVGGANRRATVWHHTMVRSSLSGTVWGPGPIRGYGVIPASVFDNVGIDAITHGASVDLIFIRNSGYKILGRLERIEVVAAIVGLARAN